MIFRDYIQEKLFATNNKTTLK